MVNKKIYVERTLKNVFVFWKVNKYLHVLQLVFDFIRSISKVSQNFQQSQKRSLENL